MSRKKVRIIHIEDEPKARLLLESIVTKFIEDTLYIGNASTLVEGKVLVKSSDFDLLFLDLNLTDGNGLELFETFPEVARKTVLCTADETKGIAAIKLGVLDYVVKPYDIQELKEVLTRVNVKTEKQHDPIVNDDRLVVQDINGAELIRLDEITRLESDRNYTKIWLNDGTNKYVSKTLKVFDGILSSRGFIRIHKSHLINTTFIKRLNKSDGGSIELINGDSFKTSLSGRELIKEQLGM